MTKTKTLEKHFKRFDYVNSDIKNGLFPLLEVSDRLEYKVFNFNKSISSEGAIQDMQLDGYEPATFSELLSWPDWNEKDLIVALGSVGVVDGNRFVPYLGRSGSKRDLDLSWWAGRGWDDVCRFLSVKVGSKDNSVIESKHETCKHEINYCPNCGEKI